LQFFDVNCCEGRKDAGGVGGRGADHADVVDLRYPGESVALFFLGHAAKGQRQTKALWQHLGQVLDKLRLVRVEQSQVAHQSVALDPKCVNESQDIHDLFHAVAVGYLDAAHGVGHAQRLLQAGLIDQQVVALSLARS
jgi:hypothetical protein